MSDYKTYILPLNDMGGWNSFIDQSSNGTIFHRYEWLKAAKEHSNMDIIPLAVNKGDTLVCLFPLFIQRKFGFKMLLSPPNSCAIPYMGPVFRIPSSNSYKQEATFIAIVESISRFIEESIGFDYFSSIHTPGIVDMRPYVWKDYFIQPNYTYTFNLTQNQQKLYNGFQPSIKRFINKALKNDDIIISKNPKYIYDILSLVKKRYSDQNKKFKVSVDYLNALLDSELSNNIESIAVIHNEHVIAGDIALTDKNNTYAWIGSVNRELYMPGIGELLIWEKIKEYIERGFKYYDIIGANTPQIRKHKAKYGAKLVNYFTVRKTSMKGKIAIDLFNVYNKG